MLCVVQQEPLIFSGDAVTRATLPANANGGAQSEQSENRLESKKNRQHLALAIKDSALGASAAADTPSTVKRHVTGSTPVHRDSPHAHLRSTPPITAQQAPELPGAIAEVNEVHESSATITTITAAGTVTVTSPGAVTTSLLSDASLSDA